MRYLLICLSLLMLFFSVLCFYNVYHVHSHENTRPVELPLPGPGFEVREPFCLTTSGSFRLEIDVPAEEATLQAIGLGERNEQCDLDLTISGEHGFAVHKSIKEISRGGMYHAGRIEIYDSERITLPSKGEYLLHLRNNASLPAFNGRGGAASLVRWEQPTETAVLIFLLQIIGPILMGLGVCGLVVAAMLAARHRKKEIAA